MWMEHGEICSGCGQWQDVEDARVVHHEVPWGPKNAHERRRWKKRGKPACSGSGKRICSPTLWMWIEC